MATATAKTEVKVTGVTLELTAEEAEVLLFVVTSITGSDKGPRGKTAAIYRALSSAGVSARRYWTHANPMYSSGSHICFAAQE